jgi:hypothetical protein
MASPLAILVMRGKIEIIMKRTKEDVNDYL